MDFTIWILRNIHGNEGNICIGLKNVILAKHTFPKLIGWIGPVAWRTKMSQNESTPFIYLSIHFKLKTKTKIWLHTTEHLALFSHILLNCSHCIHLFSHFYFFFFVKSRPPFINLFPHLVKSWPCFNISFLCFSFLLFSYTVATF